MDGIIDTDDNVQCGLVPSRDVRHIVVDSWGDGMAVSHFSVLDTWTNELTEVASFEASTCMGSP